MQVALYLLLLFVPFVIEGFLQYMTGKHFFLLFKAGFAAQRFLHVETNLLWITWNICAITSYVYMRNDNDWIAMYLDSITKNKQTVMCIWT